MISKRTKNSLVLDLVNNYPGAFSGEAGDSLLEFLMLIWDLRLMPSTDDRFEDAYGDIHQHMINNNDWDYNFLFFDRLKILTIDDSQFSKFIEAIVNPAIQKTKESIDKYAFIINSHIEKEGWLLVIDEYNELDQPIYVMKEKDGSTDIYTDFKKNSIPFVLEATPNGGSHRRSSHRAPSKTPSFVLVHNDGWNDYGARTLFDLFYYDEGKEGIHIGPLKIIYEDHEAASLGDSIVRLLPKKFETLDSKFCSLGQTEAYYQSLKKLFPRDLFSVLFSLQDVAFFPDIKETFEANPMMKSSLMRYEEQERLSRIAKPLVFGYDLNNLFKFKYYFKPTFSDEAVPVDFEFGVSEDIPNRIYALIGKNGTGKTQLITSLPSKISSKEDSFFSPRTPQFSKVIAVSYSAFDKFEIPRKTSTFNYLYCGLRNEDGEINSVRSQTLKFHNTWKKIKRLGRIETWRKILLLFIESSIVDEMIVLDSGTGKYDVNLDGINAGRSKLSSGQNIILNIISEVVANIMYDSLLLYDEPETHLHPNAITELMNTIYELVNEFQSYCIVATHSPLVIRELFSKNVFVLDKVDSTLSLRKIGIESFGESITRLTEEVFINKDTPKQYKSIIKDLVDGGRTFDEIIALIQADQVPVSLNTRIYIKSLINEKS